MQNEKRMMPLLLYYLLVASLTNLFFIAFGTSIFLLVFPSLKFDIILIVIILFVLLQKSLIVGFITNSAHKQGRFDKISGTSFIGLYFGRFFGFIIGVYLGFQIGKGIGAIAGALLFYFAGRWAGLKVGFFIGHLLDRNLLVADLTEKIVVKPSPSKKLLVTIYAAFFPLLIFLLALFLKFNIIDLVGISADWLPTARIVVVFISLFCFSAPWLIQKRMQQSQTPLSSFSILWLGFGLSIIPVIYASALFIIGASIAELGLYAIASSLAAIIWSIKTNSKNQ